MKSIAKLALIGAAALLTACGGSEKAATGKTGEDRFRGDTLVISTWGLNDDLLRDLVFDPFEDEHGVTIELDLGGTPDRYTKLASNPNTDIDLFYTAQHVAQSGIEAGLFEELDKTSIPNIDSLYDIAVSPNGEDYGMAYTVNRLRVAINPDNLPEGIEASDITSWDDLWRPELEGQISIPAITTTFGPAMVYIASGHAGVDIESDGGAAAMRELENLMPNVRRSYIRSSDAASMLQEGEISIALVADFSHTSIMRSAPDAVFVDPSEGTYVNFNTINIVKGTPNEDLAYEFINYALSEEVQGRVANAKLEAPVNKEVVLEEELQGGMTYLNALTNAQSVNAEFVNANVGRWIDEWNEIVTR